MTEQVKNNVFHERTKKGDPTCEELRSFSLRRK
uniref:Uncharacterized protein n=1 Tax=Arundo donax TaxID=35708 RepID=A0A0A8Y248_ARUDO